MAKYTGRGAEFRIGTTGATPTYTAVAQVSSIGSISISSDETEVTTLDNTDGYKEFLQTFKDAGELALSLIWDPALPTHGEAADGLWGLFDSGEIRPFQIEWSTVPPYTADFEGFVKTFPTPAATPADPLTADVSIRVSGAVTLTAGTLVTRGGPGGLDDELSADEQRQAIEAYRRQRARVPARPAAASSETLESGELLAA